MSKVIMFANEFPKYHPRAGQNTEFIEKIYTGLLLKNKAPEAAYKYYGLCDIFGKLLFNPKFHTIRGGHRFKVGDSFSPRIWLTKPYRSSQISLWSDIVVAKVWDFRIPKNEDPLLNGVKLIIEDTTIPMNDGLSAQDFIDWFDTGKDFDGQIICWNLLIDYSDICGDLPARASQIVK